MKTPYIYHTNLFKISKISLSIWVIFGGKWNKLHLADSSRPYKRKRWLASPNWSFFKLTFIKYEKYMLWVQCEDQTQIKREQSCDSDAICVPLCHGFKRSQGGRGRTAMRDQTTMTDSLMGVSHGKRTNEH